MEVKLRNAGRVLATPLAKKLAVEQGVELTQIIPSSPDGILKKTDVLAFLAGPRIAPAAAPSGQPLRATPLAKKLAAEKGVDLSTLSKADGGRIKSSDVLASSTGPMARESRREKLRGMRKVIADRMQKSYFLYPTVTLTTDADMKALQAFRAAFNEAHASEGIKLSVTDLIVAAVAKALEKFEIVNASMDGDEIVYHADVNVGIAVALEKGGLLVPVLHRANTLTLSALSKEAKRLVTAARGGALGPDDMTGGTFTVTNMGMAGIDSFNPIINYPESAILGVGRTVEKPVIIDGMIAIRPKAVLSLTHDHRLIDGMPAAKFLEAVVSYIENPNLL